MSDKLTPRQNELISHALCNLALAEALNSRLPSILSTVRQALVSELLEVTDATRSSAFSGARSIDG